MASSGLPSDQITAPLHEKLLGLSPAMQRVREVVQRLAQADITVLITGESGTGKDVAAHILHRQSPRAGKPFIKVNCPAVPESILESELFGYEKGAFTGARDSKPGRLELAHQGTLFLDEVAETSPTIQGKLLQLLDGEPVMRIGGVQAIQCDVRLVAATNVDLETAVSDGRMREDVYFRLSEMHVHIPPLRERREDIALLAEHFNYNFRRKLGREYEPIAPELIKQIRELPWRGNVRELAACVKKYVSTGNSQQLMGARSEEPVAAGSSATAPSALVDTAGRRGVFGPSTDVESMDSPLSSGNPEANQGTAPAPAKRPVDRGEKKFPSLKEAARRAVEQTERALIEDALNYTLWNRRKAAKLLDISYSSLLRRIDAYDIGQNETE